LEQPDQTALASRERSEGLNARLGVDAIAGRRVWDVESTFEVAVGPLSAIDFRSRLPWTDRSGTWPCWPPLITTLLMATTITPPWAPTDDKVQAAVERLVATARPKRIILFGSRARGDADVRSDVDLMVIKAHIVNRHKGRVVARWGKTGLQSSRRSA
jgi:hypothetical protein